MKRGWILFLTALLVSVSILPMKANDNDMTAMLFPEFKDGYIVLASNGNRLQTQLNYDLINECMLFFSPGSGTMLELELENVAMVIIGERYFLPATNNRFFEKISVGENAFFIRHQARIVSRGRYAGYGTFLETAAISGGAHIGRQNMNQTHSVAVFAPSERLNFADASAVFINDGRRYIRINSLRRLNSLFRPHRAAIEAFAAENRTVFSNVEDVKAIVTYAFSL